MKTLLPLIFVALVNSASGQCLLDKLRRLYSSAGLQQDSAKKMSYLLGQVTEKGAPVLLCYKGALTIIQAKYLYNPVSKLGCFVKGKKLVENAIKSDSSNLEMRYLRFTLQSNLPSFLCYDGQLKLDKGYLLSHCLLVSDKVLRDMIISFLLMSKYCDKEEVKKLTDGRGSSIGG